MVKQKVVIFHQKRELPFEIFEIKKPSGKRGVRQKKEIKPIIKWHLIYKTCKK